MIYSGVHSDVDRQPADVRQVFIAGAGGLGRELLSAIRDSVDGPGQPAFAGFIDESPTVTRESLAEKGVSATPWSPAEAAAQEGPSGFLLAVADPNVKERLFSTLSSLGLIPCGFVHSSAILGDAVSLGEGCLVCPGSYATTNVQVGRGVLLNPATRLGHDVTVGDFTTFLGSNAINGEVEVGSRVLVGAGAVVHPRLTIGDGSQIGIGCVLIRSIPEGASVLGNPARRIDMR